MSSNNLGSIYATTISSEKYIIIASQNIELSGNVIIKNDATLSSGLLYTNSLVPNVPNSASLGSIDKMWSNAYINDVSINNNLQVTGNVYISGNLEASNIYTKSQFDNSFQNVYTIAEFDNSYSNVYTRGYIDQSFANIYTRGHIDQSFQNVYTRGYIDQSFANVYTRELIDQSFANVYAIDHIDSSFANVYTISHIDTSFANVYTIDEFDNSYANVYTIGHIDQSFANVYNIEHIDNSFANVYTKSQVDASFVTKSLFELSYNALVAIRGTASGSGGASVNSNIIPSSTNTYNLGSTSKYWNNTYINNLRVSNRVYQEISGGINDLSWSAVNGYYGLAKDAYPSLNPITIMENMFWTRRTHVPIANNARKWKDVCWSPKLRLFVAVNTTNNPNATYSGNIGYSNDGINWNYIYANTNWHNRALYSVCWSDELGIFVACGQYSLIMYSTDGINWNASNAINFDSTRNPEGGNIDGHSICWSPQLKLFVIIGPDTTSYDSIAVSSNGVDWTSVGINYSNGWFQINLACICWSPELGLFVALDGYGPGGEKPNAYVVTSSNGFNWNIEIITQQYSTWNSICWSPQLGLFAACSTAGYHWMPSPQLMTSKDGFNWTIINRSFNESPFGGDWSDVIWCAELGLFVVSSNVSYYTGGGPYLVSSNGIDWITRDNWEYLAADGLAMHLERLCWCPQLGIIVGVGGGGGIWSGGQGGGQIWTTSLKGRPPTSYNVFDSSFNRIDETGKWDFSNIAVTTLNVTGTFTNTSDDRLKHNEVAIVNGLTIIDQLTPKFYQKTQVMLDASYNGDLSGHAWTYEAGLIAQEVLQIPDLSFAVSSGDYYQESYILKNQSNDISTNYYDYDTSANYDICYNLIKQPYGLNYNSVFVYGVAAIKELHAKVKTQETNVLDEQLNNLITRIETMETTLISPQ